MRTCGDCRLCCFEMGVEEIQKPMCSPCPSVCDTGCGIYETRPASCRTFECLWLGEPVVELKKKFFWESDRPDLAGVLFHAAGAEFTEATGVPMVVARGDFDKGQPLLQRVAQRAVVILVYADGRRKMMGPEPAVREAQKWTLREDPKD